MDRAPKRPCEPEKPNDSSFAALIRAKLQRPNISNRVGIVSGAVATRKDDDSKTTPSPCSARRSAASSDDSRTAPPTSFAAGLLRDQLQRPGSSNWLPKATATTSSACMQPPPSLTGCLSVFERRAATPPSNVTESSFGCDHAPAACACVSPANRLAEGVEGSGCSSESLHAVAIFGKPRVARQSPAG